MEKTLIIDGRSVPFKSTGATPIRYKAQFGKDFFAEIMKLSFIEKLMKKQGDILTDEDYEALGKSKYDEITEEDYNKLGKRKGQELKPEDYNALDFDVFYDVAWTFAKTADKSIPDPVTWLDSFSEFPMLDIIPELQEMIIRNLRTKKK